jgi:transcriptional regulator of acetoin/glycerol metabolism
MPLVRVDAARCRTICSRASSSATRRAPSRAPTPSAKGSSRCRRRKAFLDEVGELPLAVQPKFLHVLESGRFRRVGGSRELKTDTRVIAATNRDLEKEVARRAFPRGPFLRLNDSR